MTKFVRDNRGAASILLLIILLPSLTMAGVFLDVARTRLAQEVVASSADLALNTVMTEYDKNLKDYFGLIASCQDTEQIIQVSKDYFAAAMVSTGVETGDAADYADAVIDAFLGDEDIMDMLKISVGDTTTISPAANGAMDNPALIKEGINEFMKYRAPIDGVAELFSKIKDANVSEKLEATSAEAKLVEARENFFQKEKALIKKAEEAYKAIKAYEDAKAHTGDNIASEQYLEKFSKFLMDPLHNGPQTSKTPVKNGFENNTEPNFREIYEDAHYRMVKNLFNSHSVSGDSYPKTVMYSASIPWQSESTKYSDEKQASSANIESLVKDLNGAINQYVRAKSDLQRAWEGIGSKQNSDHPIQYWVDLTQTVKSAYYSYRTAAGDVWKKFSNLENAVAYAEEKALDTKIKPISSSYVSMPTPDKDGNVILCDVEAAVWSYYVTNIQSEATGNGSSAFQLINNQLGRLNTSANEALLATASVAHIYNIGVDLKHFAQDADKAAGLAKDAREKVAALKSKMKEYKEAFIAWKEAASDSSLAKSELAAQDKKLIEDLEVNGKLLNITDKSIDDLAGKLKNIETLFTTLAKDMRAIKYNGKSLIEVYDFPTFKSACKASDSDAPRNEASLNEYAKGLFSFSIGTEIQTIVIQDNKTSTDLDAGDYYFITDSFHPVIKHGAMANLDLYDWLYTKFKNGPPGGTPLNKEQHGFSVDDEDSAEDADKELGKKKEDTSSADTEGGTAAKNFKDWTNSTLPSAGKHQADAPGLTAKLSEAANFASNLFSNFSGTMGGAAEAIRDDLFAEYYIFSMFTHDTFDKEGYYKNLSDDAKKKITAYNTDQYYTSDVIGKWESSEDIQTPMLNDRSKANNWCYGGEIEYILYGNNTDKANKNAAYGRIFLIRYALDLAPVFDAYWDDALVDAVAVALQAFAYIPVSLTKTLICLAMTAAEAAVDVDYLKEGIPVLLIKKGKAEIFCNYQAALAGKKPGAGSKQGITLQYSEYLMMFLFVKMIGAEENNIYLRTGDVIQVNMATITGEKDFALSKSTVFFTLKATATIEPMWSRLLAIDNLGDLSTSTGWRSMEITMTRGY